MNFLFSQSVEFLSSDSKDLKMFDPVSFDCLDLPLSNLHQKIFDLSQSFCIALIQIITDKSQCQLHIKLIEKETKRFFCLDKFLLRELVRQLYRFERANIEYPCTVERKPELLVKLTTIPGEYQVIYRGCKLHLDSTAAKYLLLESVNIFQMIENIEIHMLEGFDTVDFRRNE